MERFIVYGAGNIGKAIYRFLCRNDQLDKVAAFCDRNYRQVAADCFGGIPVLPFEELRDRNLPFVLGVGHRYGVRKQLERQLTDSGCRFYRTFQEYLSRNMEEGARQEALLRFVWLVDVPNEEKINDSSSLPFKQHDGLCPICGRKTTFVSYEEPLIRNNFRCIHCHQSPRSRAFWKFMQEMLPDWRSLVIHESSPAGLVSSMIAEGCQHWSASFFYEDKPLGEILGANVTNQNLERLIFPDASFDVFVTMDVLEHVNEPDKVFSEVARVLKPGGKHIFTVPMWHGRPTYPRIRMENGQRILTDEAVWHGNPISRDGALLTYQWGDDLPDFADNNVYGTKTTIYQFPRNEDDVMAGLDAGDDIRVIVTEKQIF